MNAAIETQGLCKRFGDLVAVGGLTLAVDRGEVFGFLGHNGAGKTTAVKMLLGLVTPTAGRASLLGAPWGDRAVRARVGFLPEHFRFHDFLTAVELVTLHARLAGLEGREARRRGEAWLERVGLAPFRHAKLRTFSKGMLQRVGLAQALVHDPALVFLDEPTSGLDPGGRLLVRDILGDLRRRGTTVFLNSHLLGEVEATSDRVAFIRHGEVVRVGDLARLLDAGGAVVVRGAGFDQETVDGLSSWAHATQWRGAEVELRLRRADAVPEVVRYLVARGVAVEQVAPRRVTLDELFLQLLGRDSGR